MMITLYTTHCPHCKMIERELDKKNLEHTLVEDANKIVEFAKINNLKSAPILVVDDKVMKFEEAYKYVKEL